MLEVAHCTTLVQWAVCLLNSRQPGDRRCNDNYSCYELWFTFLKNKTEKWFLLGSWCHINPHFLSQHIYRHSSVLSFSGPILCALFNSFDIRWNHFRSICSLKHINLQWQDMGLHIQLHFCKWKGAIYDWLMRVYSCNNYWLHSAACAGEPSMIDQFNFD